MEPLNHESTRIFVCHARGAYKETKPSPDLKLNQSLQSVTSVNSTLSAPRCTAKVVKRKHKSFKCNVTPLLWKYVPKRTQKDNNWATLS